MHVHLVFVTKYRRRIFSKGTLKRLSEIFSSVCDDFESTLEEFEGERDHVHLLVTYPPKISVSRLVNSLKGVSSRVCAKNSLRLNSIIGKGSFGRQAIFLDLVEELH